MKKLLCIMMMIASTVAVGATTYDGESYTYTKSTAPSKSVYVLPDNVKSLIRKQLLAWPQSIKALNFWMDDRYPSSASGSFNINLGIDNIVGDPLLTPGSTAYSVAIGTSDKATKMHSYAFGSQINALAANSTVVGYGLTATSEYSVVIGHGKRPGADASIASEAAMQTWLKTYKSNVFPGYHFKRTDTGNFYTITEVSDTPDVNGYYYKYVLTNFGVQTWIPKNTVLPEGTIYYTGALVEHAVPKGSTYKVPTDNTHYFYYEMDYIPGGYDWRYGKSHGPGTFNIVAYHTRYGTKSPGLKAVYINDDCVDDLVGDKIEAIAPGMFGPKEMEIDAAQIEGSEENPIVIPPGSTYTLLSTNDVKVGAEIFIAAPENGGLRNYEVYIPNEPEMRAGLPCGFSLDELPPEIRRVYVNGRSMVATLPAKLTLKQPYSKLVIGEIVSYDDGWDWNPVITNCFAVWNGTKLTSSGPKLFEGYNLQAGVSLKVAYPISGGTIVTNDIISAASTSVNINGFSSGTYYDYISVFDFTPPAGQKPGTSGGTITFTYIYETKAGKVPATWDYTFDLGL